MGITTYDDGHCYLHRRGVSIVDEHQQEQELSMISLGEGKWLLSIDLIRGESVTRNPLGFVCVTGEENLYYMTAPGSGEGVERTC